MPKYNVTKEALDIRGHGGHLAWEEYFYRYGMEL